MSDMNDLLVELSDKIYLSQQHKQEWRPGEDWISYSGDVFSRDEYFAALRAISEGWLVFGKNCRKFEREFPQHLGKRRGILTNSGSSANFLMFAALKSKNLHNLPLGTKVITPAVCFPTTLNPIIQHGYEPVFVDVTLPDLNLDLDEVERVLEEDVNREIKVIIFAHVLGNPPDMDRLMTLVDKYDLIFLEDACDALGSTYRGKKLGSYGTMSTCSFYPAHHMTMGEGGFVATNGANEHKVLSSLRDWGRACYCNTALPGCVVGKTACGNRFQKWLPQAPEIIYDHRYVYSEIGYNLKPIELQGAIGLEQLKKLEMLHDRRKENFDALYSIFKKYSQYFHLPKATEGADPSWFAFLLTIREGAPFSRADFVSHLESLKIQTRSYFSGNVLLHPGYSELAQKYDNLQQRFPVSHIVTSNSFFLGTFAGITQEKIDYIEAAVDKFFERGW
jgi:CDP-6-deoxy-D-xylo-4-hexulose-3-dehydrase